MKIKLQEILDNRNISVYSLSKKIGVTQNNLGKIIKGETTSIKYDILEKMCNILNITPNDIFEIERPKKLLSDDTLNIINQIKNTNSFMPDLQIQDKNGNISSIEVKNSRPTNNIKSFIISGDDALQTREENGIYVSDNDVFNSEVNQARLNLEFEIETNLCIIIDNIIGDAENSVYYNDFKQDINNYLKTKELPLSLKLILLSMYRLIYTVLSAQNETELLAFLTRMRNIYAHGGLLDLDNDSLSKVAYSLNKYLDKNNKQKTNILKKIDIYNEYNTKQKD